MDSLQFLEQALENKNVQAFLAMIRKSEGTDGPEGYNYLFGSTAHNNIRFQDMSQHPNIHMPFGHTTSTAAGAYQIMHDTDAELTAKYGEDFHPHMQDVKAVAIMSQRNCVSRLMAGDFSFALHQCCNIWASLPGAPYGQPVHTVADVTGWYQASGGEVTV